MAEQPFLSNGGLTLVQRRVSFGEKWHEREGVKENTVKERGMEKSINSAGAFGGWMGFGFMLMLWVGWQECVNVG